MNIFSINMSNSLLAVIVSDGAGSASHGREGALLVCRIVATRVREHYKNNATAPSDEIIWSWIDDVRDVIGAIASRKNLTKRDFAATLLCAVSDGTTTTIAHIGDGAIVGRLVDDNAWRVLSWPHQGEYASVTYFVTDDPVCQLRVVRYEEPIDALAVFSDGIERLALDFSSKEAFQPFFLKMIKPIQNSGSSGRDGLLSHQLSSFLDSPSINERTDDDKTLVLAALK